MHVYVDPTELSSSSRLEEAVAGLATALPGLEELTGADLLMSNEALPLAAGSPEAMIRVHTENGILVQLKRYNDIQSSIMDGRIKQQVLKMLRWTPRAWVVVTGHLFELNGEAAIAEVQERKLLGNKVGRFVCTGRCSLPFKSVSGTMDAVAYNGGYPKTLPEGQLLPWLQQQSELLKKIKSGEVDKLPLRTPQIELRPPDDAARLAALFNGIGPKTARTVIERVKERFVEVNKQKPSLIYYVAYVTDYQAAEINGVTECMIRGWRESFGLQDYGGDGYETIGIQFMLNHEKED